MTHAKSHADDMGSERQVESQRLNLNALWERHRHRLYRSVVGLFVAAWACNVGYRYFVLAASVEALVTSDVIDVAAPIEGYFRRESYEPGVVIDKGVLLASIENTLADTSRLVEITTRLASLDGERSALEWTITRFDEIGKSFAQRGVGFQARRTRQLDLLTSQAQGTLSSNEARLLEAESRLKRTESMVTEGTSTVQDGEAARRDFAVAREAVNIAGQQVESARLAKDAQSAGFSLTDFSSTDKSYSEQRHDDVAVTLTRLRAELAQKQSSQGALSEQLRSERADYERHAHASLEGARTSKAVLPVQPGSRTCPPPRVMKASPVVKIALTVCYIRVFTRTGRAVSVRAELGRAALARAG